MVRISGGLARGRLLHVPTETGLRPTMGRVRESLFSLLARHTHGATVLDLFAGCGLLGLEALSRGAQTAFFVDLERKAVQSIEKNVTLCGVQSRSTVLQGDLLHSRTLERVKQWVNQDPGGGRLFDLVFLDPPYRKGLVAGTLHRLEQTNLLAPGAVIVVEQEATAEPDPSVAWPLLHNRRYGETRVILWQTAAQTASAQARPTPAGPP
ncbi:MAG: 16S rRNA (guanine(966)-N(2))-methyltransferase RsmD [Magnetococcales bacterium]|nr:16S rRNA (guanine(966)-N(2))-methyltransferase RsmD [Magnetococcales bacterium]